jgi:hypothetical protein
MCNILSSRKEENKEASDLFVVQFQAMATQLENYNGYKFSRDFLSSN